MRNATLQDIDTIMEMSIKMHSEGRLKSFSFNEDKVRSLLEFLINDDNGIVLITEGGFFAGMVTEHFFGNDLTSTDFALYVEENYREQRIGFDLVNEYTKMARELGAVDIGIGNSMGSTKLYENCGFTQVGGVFRMVS